MCASNSIYSLRPSCGVVAKDDEGRILLIHRSDDRTWGLPGGGVELGESWSQAAIRECREETGWLVEVAGLFGVYSDPGTQTHIYPSGVSVQFLGVVFEAKLVERAGEPGEESSEVGFFRIDDLPEPIFPADLPVIEDLASQEQGPFIR